MFGPACPSQRTQNGRKFSLLVSVTIINLVIILTQWSQNILLTYGAHDIRGSAQDAKNATNPLIYTRLRFDHGYLQIYRRYQRYLTMHETKVTLEVNQTQANNKIRPVKYTYYQNNKFDSTSLSQDDIIFEALDRLYLNRLFPTFLFTYDDKRDMAQSSDPKLVSRERCNRELNFLINQLNVIQTARLSKSKYGFKLNNTLSLDVLALFDAYGTEEPGLIQGNNVWSGNWRQCKKSLIFNRDTENPDNTLEFKSRYCIASIRSKRWDKIAASRIPEWERRRHFKYPEQKYDYARFHRIQIGLCLPESCDSSLIDQRREDVRRLATHKLSQPLRSYDLADLYCLPDETSKLREVNLSGRLFMIFITAWLALTIWATVYDNHVGLNKKLKGPVKATGFIEKMADSMSVIRNFARLTQTDLGGTKQPTQQATSDKDVKQASKVELMVGQTNKLSIYDLLFTNCIKALATLAIFVGHCGMMFRHLDRYTLDYDVGAKPIENFISSAIFFVDWHFVTTGFVTSYAMFLTKRVELNNLADWLHTIVHRYLRLAPLYILMFWFAKSVFKHTSSGPLWDYGTNNMTLRAICQRESFIYPLTLTSDFHPIHEECILPSWYLACDFQYYLITPLLLILLNKSPIKGWLVSLGGIGACIALRSHSYLTDPRAKHLDLMKPRHDTFMRINWDIHATYIYPQYRIASYLIGILAGHYAYMVLSGQWQSALFYDRSAAAQGGARKSTKDDARISRRKDLLGFVFWTFSVIILITMMFITAIISHYPTSMEPHIKNITTILYSTGHSAVSLAMSLFLIIIMFGQFRSIRRVMSWPVWTALTRISYFFFMAQVETIFWINQSADMLFESNTFLLWKVLCYLFPTLCTLSIILTILFELPIAQMERNFVAPIFKSFGSAAQITAPPTPSPSITTRRNRLSAT